MIDRASFRELDAAERRLLAFALVAAPIVALGLSVLGLSRMRGALATPSRPSHPAHRGGAAAAARARSVARVVDLAASRGVVAVGCLARSLLTCEILARDGIEARLRIGVLREGEVLRAHAWVEHAGVPLNDGADVALRFLPFDRDFAGPLAPGP